MSLAVGIDLGTSNSCVAIVRDGEPVVLSDSEGHNTQPSVVAYGHGRNVAVGHRARRQLIYAPQNTVASAKRLIGRRFKSPEVQAVLASTAYGIVEGPHQDARVRVQGKVYAVPEISAHVIQHMRRIAEEATGEVVDKAVITVPAHFNDHQRQATRDAAKIAGLDCLRILNEPTAAALAYGFNRGHRQHILVYDLGGGTFDVSVLRLDGDIFEVVSTAGDNFLGGDDFDYQLGDHLMAIFERQTGVDLTENRTARLKLREAAERAKIALSRATQVEVHVPNLSRDASGKDLELSYRITRKEYAKLVMPQVQRTMRVCDEALGLAKMAASQIDHIILVGGMTRYHLIRHAVAQYFGRDAYSDMNPDEVVAQGAAIQAHNLTNLDDGPGAVLLDVTPQSLGVRTVGGFCEVLIPRNTPIPTHAVKAFHTAHDNQTEVRISVYQGESRMADDNELLGAFVLDGLREAPRGEVKVRVSFEIDADGIVNVLAEDVEHQNARDLRIEASSGLTDEEVQAMKFDDLGF